MGVQSVESVLVDFEDGELAQVSNRVRQGLYGVLAQVQVCEVGEAPDSNRNVF